MVCSSSWLLMMNSCADLALHVDSKSVTGGKQGEGSPGRQHAKTSDVRLPNTTTNWLNCVLLYTYLKLFCILSVSNKSAFNPIHSDILHMMTSRLTTITVYLHIME